MVFEKLRLLKEGRISTLLFEVRIPEVEVHKVEQADDHQAYADGRDGVKFALP
jgi:hypothetical protein